MTQKHNDSKNPDYRILNSSEPQNIERNNNLKPMNKTEKNTNSRRNFLKYSILTGASAAGGGLLYWIGTQNSEKKQSQQNDIEINNSIPLPTSKPTAESQKNLSNREILESLKSELKTTNIVSMIDYLLQQSDNELNSKSIIPMNEILRIFYKSSDENNNSKLTNINFLGTQTNNTKSIIKFGTDSSVNLLIPTSSKPESIDQKYNDLRNVILLKGASLNAAGYSLSEVLKAANNINSKTDIDFLNQIINKVPSWNTLLTPDFDVQNKWQQFVAKRIKNSSLEDLTKMAIIQDGIQRVGYNNSWNSNLRNSTYKRIFLTTMDLGLGALYTLDIFAE